MSLQNFLLCCTLITRGHVCLWPLYQEALTLHYDPPRLHIYAALGKEKEENFPDGLFSFF